MNQESSASVQALPVAMEGGRAVSFASFVLVLQLGLLAVPLAVGSWIAFHAPLNHDVAWGLYSARRVMEGARPYIDFVETNPPLFIYLSMPLEWVALATGWAESSVLATTLIGLTLGVAVVCFRILRHAAGRSGGVTTSLLFAAFYAALVLPGIDFAQREHAAFLLILPYCTLCALRAASDRDLSRALSIGTGLLAGVGVALKPHFVAPWLALVAAVALARRRPFAALTPENVAVASVVGLYAAIVLLLTPEYVTDVVPRVYQQYERAYAVGFGALLADPIVQGLAIAGLVLLAGAGLVSRERFAAALIRCATAASLMFLVVYLVQLKGYYYHRFPAVAFYLVAIAVASAAFARTLLKPAAEQGPRPRYMLALRTAVLAVGLVPGFIIVSDSIMVQQLLAQARANGVAFYGIRHAFVDLVREKAAGRPVYVLSSSVAPAFPLVNLSGATWPYRYNCLWPLPIHYRDDVYAGPARYRSPATQSAAERAFFDDVVSQLRAAPPVFLIVEQSRFKQGFGLVDFDYLKYFQQSSVFTDLFREYTPIVTDGPYAIYERRVTRERTR